jgi:predicted transcriptional regulator
MDNIIGWNTRVINPLPMVTNTPSDRFEAILPDIVGLGTIVKISKTRKQYFLTEKESGYF